MFTCFPVVWLICMSNFPLNIQSRAKIATSDQLTSTDSTLPTTNPRLTNPLTTKMVSGCGLGFFAYGTFSAKVTVLIHNLFPGSPQKKHSLQRPPCPEEPSDPEGQRPPEPPSIDPRRQGPSRSPAGHQGRPRGLRHRPALQ